MPEQVRYRNPRVISFNYHTGCKEFTDRTGRMTAGDYRPVCFRLRLRPEMEMVAAFFKQTAALVMKERMQSIAANYKVEDCQ